MGIDLDKKNTVGAVRDPRDLVNEYDQKLADIPNLYAGLNTAKDAVDNGCVVAGSYGRGRLWNEPPRLYIKDMRTNLLRSAWWAAYGWCNMEILATAEDKKKIEIEFQNPIPFTVDNLVATFGPYLADQRTHILRGLAEAFISLDDAYKSHAKVKVGVKGLPKRVILNNVSTYRYGHGWNKFSDMLNALQVFDGDGLVDKDILNKISNKEIDTYRGLTFKWFHNGNVHIHFDPHACLQINRGLAEYYGDVLPDIEPDKTDMKPDLNKTDVSKDLQYYPTPVSVAQRAVRDIGFYDGDLVLEPSCGCGRLLDAIKGAVNSKERRSFGSSPPNVTIQGIEYDRSRANQSRAKGYHITEANFLEVDPVEKYNTVIMNPPFYGKHYLKHIQHALLFLKSGGTLVSILPATAHYDHKALPEGYRWKDLPVGSFAESGVRVPTGYATWVKK